jgi:hypothetical protein
MIYTEVVKRRTDGGCSPTLDPNQTRQFKPDNLEWMIKQAIDMKLCEDGLKFCDEYMAASAGEVRGNPRTRHLDVDTTVRKDTAF